MTEVFVAIGSNVRPEEHVRQAVRHMRRHFGNLRLSPVYLNKAVGFEGDDFLNLVTVFSTALSLADTAAALDEIEVACGRKRGAAKFSPRTIDLDLLLYGLETASEPVTLPRKEILEYAFVLKPLTDLAPEHRHPVTRKPYAEHWREFAGDKGGLTPVNLAGL